MNPEKYNHLREKFTAPAENYEFIKSKNQSVNEARNIWDDDYVREALLESTDRLIGVLDGSIEYEPKERDKANPELSKMPPEVVIALDKSGRPAVDLADAFWDQRAVPDATKPEFDFLNIDRVEWLQKMGYTKKQAEESTKKDIHLDKITDDDISRIRAYFVNGDLSEDNWQQEVWNLPTRLDDKRIMILDEMQASGATLEIAVGLLRRAIPDAAVVTGDVFWRERTSRPVKTTDIHGEPTTVQQGVTAPVWYDREIESGRGVGDINIAYHDRQYSQNPTQENLKRKIASIVVSPPLLNKETLEPVVDKRYQALNQDFAFMTYDYADGKIFRRDTDRDVAADDTNEQGITNSEMWKYGGTRQAKMRDQAARKTNMSPRK